MKQATTLLAIILFFADCTKSNVEKAAEPQTQFRIVITNTSDGSVLDNVYWNGVSAFPDGAIILPGSSGRDLDSVTALSSGNSLRCVVNAGGYNYDGGGDRLIISNSNGDVLLDSLLPHELPFDYTIKGLGRSDVNVSLQ